ncbi:ABC-type transport auxiliary lipoprotein family protein [Guyparkeria sp. 1SP6A2]|nr:ABC-type transport auxiliary lipoprotein family protein [Guyparkeria sp. 1SP6A2]
MSMSLPLTGKMQSPSMPLRLGLFALVVTLLAGCSVLPQRGEAPSQWRLVANEVPGDSLAGDRQTIIRLIEPRAASSISRRDMAYSTGPQSVAYYRDNRWAAPPAVMFNEILDETFSAQPWVASVVRGDARVPAHLSLYCEINRLEHLVGQNGGEVRLKVSCSWYRAADRKLLDARVFDRTTTIRTNDAEHYAGAAQTLIDGLMSELVASGRRLAMALPSPQDAPSD